MRSLRKFASLDRRERLLLFRAVGCMLRATIYVRILPYRWLRRWIQTEPDCSRKSSHCVTTEQIGWAVDCVARRSPASSCLIRALAARTMLARYGYAAKLRIGVSRDDAGQFTSHAWLEQNGCAVLGGRTAPLKYVVMDIPVGSVSDSCTPPERSMP